MFEKLKQHRIIIGTVVFLLLMIAIPVTITFLGQQQETRSRAAGGAVSVILDPLTKAVNVDELFNIEVYINAGSNDVSAVDIQFTYDISPIAEVGGGGIRSFTPSSVFSTLINSGSRYVGVNPTSNPVTGNVKLGTLHVYPGSVGTATVGFSKIHINASGVDGALPIDTDNTKAGTYTVTAATASITPTPTGGLICGQAFTWGRNTTTGECKYFPTTCLDPGYVQDQTCALTGTPNPTPTCVPRPICLDSKPACAFNMPEGGAFCPTTPTPTAIFTPTPTRINPTATRIPTATLFPTPTVAAGQTAIALSLKLTGVGLSANIDNLTPQRPQRNIQVLVINSQNNQTASLKGVATLNSQTGLYRAIVGLGNGFPSGVYLIKVKMDNTLWKQVPGIQNITVGTINETQTATLVAGDLNGDNEINLLDYNLLLTCLKSNSCRKITMTKTELSNLAYIWAGGNQNDY